MARNEHRAWCVIAAVGMAASLAFAQQPSKEATKPAPKPTAVNPAGAPGAKPGAAQPGQPSADDMKKMMDTYMESAKPGKMHEWLAKGAGTWHGNVKSFEAPGQPPQESTCTSVVTPMMDGRFMRTEVKGEMDMGGMKMNFEGFGLVGYDNTTKKFVQSWADNMGTGIMNGTGELSADGKVLTWTMTFNDPATNKTTTMRQVETRSNDNTMKLEMFGANPMDPSGKETKMMEIDFTREAGGKPAPTGIKPAPSTPKR